MHCMSCQRETPGKDATLWQRRVFLCRRCSALADKAKAEMDQAHRRAEALALQLLEQQILHGGLLEVPMRAEHE